MPRLNPRKSCNSDTATPVIFSLRIFIFILYNINRHHSTYSESLKIIRKDLVALVNKCKLNYYNLFVLVNNLFLIKTEKLALRMEGTRYLKNKCTITSLEN